MGIIAHPEYDAIAHLYPHFFFKIVRCFLCCPKYRLTPLHHIAMRGNRDLLQQLLPEQPDLDAQDLQVSQVSSEQKKR